MVSLESWEEYCSTSGMILCVSLSIFRKMQISGAADLASKSQGFSDSTTVKPKEEIVDSYHMDKIRCICGSSLPTDSMIKVSTVCLLKVYKADIFKILMLCSS